MGRLAGFSYREVVRKLRTFGFVFDRPGPGSHEVWRHAAAGRSYRRGDTRTHFTAASLRQPVNFALDFFGRLG